MTQNVTMKKTRSNRIIISSSAASISRSMNRRNMMELSIAVMYMLQAAVVLECNVGGALAYHVVPPGTFYRGGPPDFGRRRGRRRPQFSEDHEQQQQPPPKDFDQEPDNIWFHNEHQRHGDDFYPPPHYFHHGPHQGRFPPPPPPFPPPPPHFAHPRFMDQPPPPHLPQSPVLQYEEHEQQDMSYAQLSTASGTFSSSALEHHEQKAAVTTSMPVKNIWKTSAPTLVESCTLETFAFDTPAVERVQILLKKGRRHGRKTGQDPVLQAHIDVWHGPDSTPQNVAIYLEDEDDDDDDDDDLVFMGGEDDEIDDDDTTNFSAIIQTPQGYNTIAVRNTAPNHDLLACVEGEEEDPSDADTNGRPHYHVGGDPSGYYYDEPLIKPETISRAAEASRKGIAGATDDENGSPLQSVIDRLMATSIPQLVEGKATSDRNSVLNANDMGIGEKVRTDVHTVPLASNVASVQVLLRSHFMHPLQARVELILKEQGSNGNPGRVLKRTIVEVFSEDGMHRPFFAVLEVPRKRKRKNRRQGHSHDDDEKRYSVSMRVINCSGSDFPLYASVEPYVIDTSSKEKKAQESRTNTAEGNSGPSGQSGEGEAEFSNKVDNINYDNEGEDILEDDWWEQSMEKAHFGGGSHYDMSTNSTILDAEIL